MKLTGAMLVVLVLDGLGYLIAVDHVAPGSAALVAMLKDIFVVVGLLTISVGLVLPGMIAHTANQVKDAAQDLAEGTLADLTAAMEAMAGRRPRPGARGGDRPPTSWCARPTSSGRWPPAST